jgi:hypothetical protein
VWGEPTKNGKEIFGFDSPLQNSEKSSICILALLVALFSVFAARRGAFNSVAL